MLEHKEIIAKYRELTEIVNSQTVHDKASQIITADGEVSIEAQVTRGENNHFVCIPVPRPTDLAAAYRNWKHIVVNERGANSLSIGLEMRDIDYLHSFGRVVQDLVESCKSVHDDEKRQAKLQARLSEWHQFFREYRATGLSIEEQRGLYGELLLLRDYLIPQMGYEFALDSWCGPDKRSKDYVNGSQAIEVKTSSAKNNEHVVKISSLHQLDDTGTDELWLYTVNLDMESTTGETLPGIIQDIKAMCKGDAVAQAHFELKLGQIGYHPSQSGQYTNVFTVFDESMYSVQEGFPRILGIVGIPSAKYDVDLRECINYKQKGIDEVIAKYAQGSN